MAGKRIPDLDPLSGAASANDDKLVVYDASVGTTKRIDRSQLAAGLVGDLPYTPSGGISATTVPTAIAELDSEAAKSATLAASGGAALIGTATGQTVQGAIDGVTTRTALKALTSAAGRRVYLTEAGREGVFIFRSGDYSAQVTADTQEGIYIKADAVAASSGAWVRQYDGNLHVKWWGAVGDNATVNTTALREAFAAAISQQATLEFDNGTYVVDAPLILGPWTGSAWSGFASFNAVGPTRNFGGSLGAAIRSTATDTPAVIIQNGRGIYWDVAVLGPNQIETNIAANRAIMADLASYDLGTCRDSRYSPQAGICIDAFGTSVPADGGYPGLSAYYAAGASGSSDVQIDALIYYNIVGICITPNQVTQNAENIDISRCRISYNKVGVAIGQSQARNVVGTGVTTSFCGICFDGKTYGRQQGVMPRLYSVNVSGRWFMNFSPGFGTPPLISGMHAENLFSLGSYYGPASINEGIVFEQAFVKFASKFDGTNTPSEFPDAHFISSHNAIFIGGFFSVADNPGPIRFYCQNGLTFKGTAFQALQNENPLYNSTGTANVQNQSVVYEDCFLVNDGTRGQSSARSLFTSKARIFSWTQLQYCPTTIDAEYTFQDNAARSRNRYWNSEIINDTYRLISATQAITVAADGVGTMTVPDGSVIRTGDMIVSITSFTPEGFAASTWNVLGVVTTVVGNDVTFVGVPQGIASGTYNIYHTWTPRLHNQSTGDVTSGSNSIVNVTNPTTWKVGHRIKGTGIPAGAYVTGVSGTTVTISTNATATNTTVRLYDANIYTAAGSAY